MRNDLSERMDRAAEHDGWTWLLPAGEHGHLVCVDDGSGRCLAALAPLCRRLSVVALERCQADRLRRLAEDWELAAVSVFLPGEIVAIGEQPVDGVVINLLGARLPAGLALAPLCRQLLTMSSVTPGAFAYLASANRLAYNRLGRLGRLGRLASLGSGDSLGRLGVARRRLPLTNGPGTLRRLLQGAAYRAGVAHPMVVYGPRVFEILQPSSKRRSYGEESGVAGRLRQLALGPSGRGLFAPAYGLAGFRGPARPTRLAALLQAVGELDERRAEARLDTFLVAADKIVLMFESGDHPGGGHVVVVPTDAQGWRKREVEIETLEALRLQVPPLAHRVPQVLTTGSSSGRQFVVIERFDGVCIDMPVADLEARTEEAADFLIELHGATRSDRTVDEPTYQSLFGELFAAAVARHPGAGEFLDQLERNVRELVMGRRVPVVWEHGDFKIENVIFGLPKRQLVGVIDWETSRPKGLPLLDLLFLLVYNHTLETGVTFRHAYREVVLLDAWRPRELALLRRYLAAIPLDPLLLPALEAMLAVHTLARRLRFDMANPGERRALMELITAATARAGEAALSPAGRLQTGTEG